MGKKVLLIFVGLLLAFVALAVFSPSPEIPPSNRISSAAPPPVASEITTGQRVWRTVKEWSGSGPRDTETFTTTAGEWRISWVTSNETSPGAGTLRVAVYNDKHELVTEAADVKGVKSDHSTVREPAGQYYLKINSSNANWAVKVEESR